MMWYPISSFIYTRNARGIAAYGHVAYNLGVAETNLVLRIA